MRRFSRGIRESVIFMGRVRNMLWQWWERVIGYRLSHRNILSVFRMVTNCTYLSRTVSFISISFCASSQLSNSSTLSHFRRVRRPRRRKMASEFDEKKGRDSTKAGNVQSLMPTLLSNEEYPPSIKHCWSLCRGKYFLRLLSHTGSDAEGNIWGVEISTHPDG